MEPGFRCIVDDVRRAVAFYELLGFADVGPPADGFALLQGHGIRLMLNAPGAGGAGRADDAGDVPAPGGWNRVQLVVDDVAAEQARLESAGARVRTRAVRGRGGVQCVVEDPSGNPVELFSPGG